MSLPTDAEIEAAALRVDGDRHWEYGAQWMRAEARARDNDLADTLTKALDGLDVTNTKTLLSSLHEHDRLILAVIDELRGKVGE